MRPITLITICTLTMPAHALMITVEPDDHAAGSKLTHVSDHVTITTLNGHDVFSSTYAFPGDELNDGIPTGAIGDRVFSSAHDHNSEWITLFADFDTTSLTAIKDTAHGSLLLFEFSRSINYFSMLGMELYSDAGPGSDVNHFYFYDEDGGLLGDYGGYVFHEIPVEPSHQPPWPVHGYSHHEYSQAGIKYVVASGDSEPGTFDRLRFRIESVPEPSTLALMGLGLLSIVNRKKPRA